MRGSVCLHLFVCVFVFSLFTFCFGVMFVMQNEGVNIISPRLGNPNFCIGVKKGSAIPLHFYVPSEKKRDTVLVGLT